MTQMNSNYETLYGVHLLDDLHNYFPALLYDSSSFHSVQSVLQYIQQQTRTRFDLFSYGLREYLSTNSREPSIPVVHQRTWTSGVGVPGSQAPVPSTFPVGLSVPVATPPQARRAPLTVDVRLGPLHTDEDEDDGEDGSAPLETALSRALLNLLTVPSGALTRNYVLPNLTDGRGTLEQMLNGGLSMNQFLQPVVVRPTAEQIAQNTTVGNLVSDTEQTCAICQDALTSDQEGRKLTACGHWFHKSCIDTWLSGNVNCPVCRHDIREPLETQESQSSDDDL